MVELMVVEKAFSKVAVMAVQMVALWDPLMVGLWVVLKADKTAAQLDHRRADQ
jgi:hypothetical protein